MARNYSPSRIRTVNNNEDNYVSQPLYKLRHRIASALAQVDPNNTGMVDRRKLVSILENQFRLNMGSTTINNLMKSTKTESDQCNYRTFLDAMEKARGPSTHVNAHEESEPQVNACRTLRDKENDPPAGCPSYNSKTSKKGKPKELVNEGPAPLLRRIFHEHFDKEGTGFSSHSLIKEGFRSLGVNLSEQHINRVIRTVDPKNTGYLDYCQFVQIMQHSAVDTPLSSSSSTPLTSSPRSYNSAQLDIQRSLQGSSAGSWSPMSSRASVSSTTSRSDTNSTQDSNYSVRGKMRFQCSGPNILIGEIADGRSDPFYDPSVKRSRSPSYTSSLSGADCSVVSSNSSRKKVVDDDFNHARRAKGTSTPQQRSFDLLSGCASPNVQDCQPKTMGKRIMQGKHQPGDESVNWTPNQRQGLRVNSPRERSGNDSPKPQGLRTNNLRPDRNCPPYGVVPQSPVKSTSKTNAPSSPVQSSLRNIMHGKLKSNNINVVQAWQSITKASSLSDSHTSGGVPFNDAAKALGRLCNMNVTEDQVREVFSPCKSSPSTLTLKDLTNLMTSDNSMASLPLPSSPNKFGHPTNYRPVGRSTTPSKSTNPIPYDPDPVNKSRPFSMNHETNSIITPRTPRASPRRNMTSNGDPISGL